MIIGHLSNLSREKGLDLVMDTFKGLRKDGVSVKLILAGPVTNKEAAATLREALQEFPHDIQYRGAVHGINKQTFYDELDVFLFPTRYRHEIQGIVQLEAIASGVPVIAYGRGCIESDLANGGGLVVSPTQGFVEPAVTWLRNLSADWTLMAKARALANARFRTLHKSALAELETFHQTILHGRV